MSSGVEGNGAGFSSQEQQLQTAIAVALEDLDLRWRECLRAQQAEGAATRSGGVNSFFQLGKRLGQFMIAPTLALGALVGKLALLKESEVIRSKKKLTALDAEAAAILVRQLPQIDAERERAVAERRRLEGEKGQSGWQGSILEIGLYFTISIALFVAEFSLATQITQEALLLRNPWVFSLALACLTLAFKFLADRFFTESSRSGLIYTVAMVVLFLALMLPVSFLRTQTVLDNTDDIGGSGGIAWADGGVTGAPNDDSMPGSDSPVNKGLGKADRSNPDSASPSGSASTPFYLKASFFLSSILFPLLSGAGFSRLQRSLDEWRKDKERKDRVGELRRSASEMEEKYNEAHERLSVLAEETSQTIVTLGETLDGTSLYVSRICDLLSADKDLSGLGGALSRQPGSETLNSFLATVRDSKKDELADPWKSLRYNYYVSLLAITINSRHSSKLDLLEKQLSGQLSAEVEAGYNLGKRTRFQLFAGEDRDELLRISDLNKYHRAIFDEESEEDADI